MSPAASMLAASARATTFEANVPEARARRPTSPAAWSYGIVIGSNTGPIDGACAPAGFPNPPKSALEICRSVAACVTAALTPEATAVAARNLQGKCLTVCAHALTAKTGNQ